MPMSEMEDFGSIFTLLKSISPSFMCTHCLSAGNPSAFLFASVLYERCGGARTALRSLAMPHAHLTHAGGENKLLLMRQVNTRGLKYLLIKGPTIFRKGRKASQ